MKRAVGAANNGHAVAVGANAPDGPSSRGLADRSGVTAAHMCWENDFGRVYAGMAGYATLGVLQLLALARYGGGTVDWSGAGGWIYLLFVLSVLSVGLYGWLEARRRIGRLST